MSWLGLMTIIIGLYLAFKVVGLVLKIAMWALVVVGGYWLIAPYAGWPALADVFQVLGP